MWSEERFALLARRADELGGVLPRLLALHTVVMFTEQYIDCGTKHEGKARRTPGTLTWDSLSTSGVAASLGEKQQHLLFRTREDGILCDLQPNTFLEGTYAMPSEEPDPEIKPCSR